MANLSGSWLGTYWQWEQPTRFELVLVQGGNSLTGQILDDSILGEASVTGEVIGRRICFTKRYVSSRYLITYEGVVAENETVMSGNWHIDHFDSGRWEAIKNDNEQDLHQVFRRYQQVPLV